MIVSGAQPGATVGGSVNIGGTVGGSVNIGATADVLRQGRFTPIP